MCNVYGKYILSIGIVVFSAFFGALGRNSGFNDATLKERAAAVKAGVATYVVAIDNDNVPRAIFSYKAEKEIVDSWSMKSVAKQQEIAKAEPKIEAKAEPKETVKAEPKITVKAPVELFDITGDVK